MDNKELRRAAAQEFMKSLEEDLKENFMSESPPKQKRKPLPKPTSKKNKNRSQFTLSELEEAIEDIDQYMENQHKEN
ncbi:MAG: hypothetical protein F6K35_14375 [Okeania sp. SIO2H7]|nr:hypothetical protein [Okeania sp. SIO2H7]